MSTKDESVNNLKHAESQALRCRDILDDGRVRLARDVQYYQHDKSGQSRLSSRQVISSRGLRNFLACLVGKRPSVEIEGVIDQP